MAFFNIIRIFVLTIIVTEGEVFEHKLNIHNSYDAICSNTTSDRFFDDKAVVGKSWRVYFAWNMNLDEFCMGFTFKYADKLTINSLKLDIESLKIQPPWSKDVLLISVTASPDMLLFNDISGIPGLFVGMICDEDSERLQPKTHKMALKLLHDEQYLLMADCSFGTTSLSVQKENRPKRSEIEAVAANLTFGDPFPACILDKDLEE